MVVRAIFSIRTERINPFAEQLSESFFFKLTIGF